MYENESLYMSLPRRHIHPLQLVEYLHGMPMQKQAIRTVVLNLRDSTEREWLTDFFGTIRQVMFHLTFSKYAPESGCYIFDYCIDLNFKVV
jgi:hypothetical protein